MDRLRVDEKGTVVRVAVHVQPRASRSEIIGQHGAALKVRLQAPPVDGAANEALVRLLADALNVPERSVRVVAGGAARSANSMTSRAPPVDGAANEALVRLLAEALKVPERSVRVVAGATSRSKVVEVDGTTADAVRALASAGET